MFLALIRYDSVKPLELKVRSYKCGQKNSATSNVHKQLLELL